LVFAAASLRDAFESMEGEFERAEPALDVEFNFAGSQQLRAQIEHGARADVFASADEKHMAELVRSSLVYAPTVFARNEPVLLVSANGAVRRFEELPQAERLVIGAEDVPIGRYSIELLNKAEVSHGPGFLRATLAKVVSRELNVRQVVAKLNLGEADAAIVYRSDVQAARAQLRVIEIPKHVNVVAQYPIAVVAGTTNLKAAQRWVTYSLSDAGQAALGRAGFSSLSSSERAP
jgi:molybdate transport system substrate-binding protein